MQVSSIGAGDSVKAIDDKVCTQLASIRPKPFLLLLFADDRCCGILFRFCYLGLKALPILDIGSFEDRSGSEGGS